MTQQESIRIWLNGSKDALDTAQKLLESKKYNHSLFFLHLAIEKALKATYIQKYDNAPPYTHDLVVLAEKCSIDITEELKMEFSEISGFNVSARYEDYKYQMYKKATKEYTDTWFGKGADILSRLYQNL